MTDTKHTPGPWVYEKGARIKSANGWLLASAWHTAKMPDASEQREPGESWLDASNRLKPERDRIEAAMEANARLIAAAPCLLAELQAIHDSAPACWWNLPIEQQQRIKAALAKATQEQPK